MMRRFIFLTVCALVAFPFCAAEAMYIPQIELAWSGGGETGSWTSSYEPGDVTDNGGDSFWLYDLQGNENFAADWTITYDPDPYVIADICVTNTSNETQLFTFTLTLDIDNPFPPYNTYFGGDMSGSFTTDSEGGTLATVGTTALYIGMIDGINVLPLHGSFSLTRTSQGTTPIPYAGDGLPPDEPRYYGGPVVNEIGIEFTFTLTPEDAVAMTGYFEVVPEPATIILFGLGGLVFLGKRH